MPKVYYPLTPEAIRRVVVSNVYPQGSSAESRLLAGLERHGKCLLWTGRTNESGYGVMTVFGIRGCVRTHRVAWVIANGPIPPGLDVLHTCDCPPCSDISHLFLGTQADNVHDCFRKGRGRPGAATGERNRHAILTEADVREIRRQWEEERVPHLTIASAFGIKPKYVSNLVRRKTWKHIP